MPSGLAARSAPAYRRKETALALQALCDTFALKRKTLSTVLSRNHSSVGDSDSQLRGLVPYTAGDSLPAPCRRRWKRDAVRRLVLDVAPKLDELGVDYWVRSC